MAALTLHDIAQGLLEHMRARSLNLEILNSLLGPSIQVSLNDIQPVSPYQASKVGDGDCVRTFMSPKTPDVYSVPAYPLSLASHDPKARSEEARAAIEETDAEKGKQQHPGILSSPQSSTNQPQQPVGHVSHPKGQTRDGKRRAMDNSESMGCSKKVKHRRKRTSTGLPFNPEYSPPTAGMSLKQKTIDASNAIQKRQLLVQDLANMTQDFASKWAKRTKTFCDWRKLERYAIIGSDPQQRPFEYLDSMFERISTFGTLKVQAAFARNVRAWVMSPHGTLMHCPETPAHLQSVEGLDRHLLQNFWKRTELARHYRGLEGLATLLRRKALVDLIFAYEQVIDHIRAASANGSTKLRSGERAGSRARKILYQVLYPKDHEHMRSLFNYDQQCATPYVRLAKHYNSIGILAMIPSKLNELDFRSTDARFSAFVDVLDIIRPEFHGHRLQVYAKFINSIAEGEKLSNGALDELDRLTNFATPFPDSLELENTETLLSSHDSCVNEGQPRLS